MHPPHDSIRPDRLAALLFASLSAACALAGCTSADHDPALDRGSTVVVATSDETGLLPTETSLEYIPFSPLVAWGDGVNRQPRLARTWESSLDGRVRTYHLRSDVRWQDGEPFTARDVEFTVDLLTHPDVLGIVGAGVDSVIVVDDSTVRIFANHPSYLDDLPIYPRHLLHDLPPEDIWSWDFWMQPVGTGPFRFVRRIPETLIEFEANPDYFRGEPRVKRLILKFVGEAKISELLSGNADIVDHARPEDWTQIENDGRFAVVHTVYMNGGAMGLYMNHRHPLFADSRVRRAFTLAIDRREILRALALPSDIQLFDAPITLGLLRRGSIPVALPYDPDLAVEILEETGWRDSDGDGVREKDGRPARFTLLSRSPARAVLVQEHLRRVGLRADILNLESSVVWERVARGDFDAAIHVVQDNVAWLERHFGHNSATGYANPIVSELLHRGTTLSHPDSVDAVYAELGEPFRRDLPLVYLHPWIGTQLVHRRIRGPEEPLRGNLIWGLDELWVEEGE